VPIGALIATLIFKLSLRKEIPIQRLYLYCFMGYSLSGFIDACTSYGTYLFWPLLNERISFHIISIVDPVFTGILLISVINYLYKKNNKAVMIALHLCGIYLIMGIVQLQRAEALALALAHERGHSIEKVVLKPTLGNILLWRSTYIANDVIYVDAIRVGLTDTRIYPGEWVARYKPQDMITEIPEYTRLHKDILRFERFSDGFIALDPERPNVLGDMRYSMVPNSVKPLWGIIVDKARLAEHAEYNFYRDSSKKDRQRFWAMLLGN
jgi:inner membrane protein